MRIFNRAHVVFGFLFICLSFASNAWSGNLQDRLAALEEKVLLLEQENFAQQTALSSLEQKASSLEQENFAQQAALDSLSLEISSQQSVIGLQQQAISVLESNLALEISKTDSFASEIEALKSNSVLALDGKLTYVTDRYGYATALFTGVNVQVVNGGGSTGPGTGAVGTTNGVGNLIVGYNEERTLIQEYCSEGSQKTKLDCETYSYTWAKDHKTGSHNLIVGWGHNYSQNGGVLFGEQSVVNAHYATVTGGSGNVAASGSSNVSGGVFNMAGGPWSSVTGGMYNQSSGIASVVTGGRSNLATGTTSTVSGGDKRSAIGDYDWAAGTLFEDY